MKKVVSYLIHSFIASSLDTNVDHSVLQGTAHIEFQGNVINSLKKKKKHKIIKINGIWMLRGCSRTDS